MMTSILILRERTEGVIFKGKLSCEQRQAKEISQSVLRKKFSALGSTGYTGETVLTEQSRLLM